MTNKNVQTEREKKWSEKRLALTKRIEIQMRDWMSPEWLFRSSYSTGTAIQKYHQIEIGTYTGDAVIKMSCVTATD